MTKDDAAPQEHGVGTGTGLPSSGGECNEVKAGGDERDRKPGSYWRKLIGFPIPRWIEELAGRDAVHLYYQRYSEGMRQRAHWHHMACAIELEHRRRPVATIRDLWRATVRVRSVDYDYKAADELAALVNHGLNQQYLETCRRVEEWSIADARRDRENRPEAIRLRLELERKQLPQGATANLALMRTILGISRDDGG